MSRFARCAGAAAFAAALMLSACGGTGSILSSKVDYGSSKVVAPLDVPPDLTRPRADDRYSVPGSGSQSLSDLQRSQGGQQPGASRSTGNVLPGVAGVTLERDGAQRWLQVKMPADQVWPIVREFWQESGFVIANESPEVGILDTDWAENRAKIDQGVIRNTLGRVFNSFYATGERDRYRARLERVDDSTTNIFVTHRGMVEVYADRQSDTTRWQPRPSDPSLEAEFLRRLMLQFGGDVPATLQAQAATAGNAAAPGASAVSADRVRLAGEGPDRVVVIDDGFDRAWRRVGLALDRTGFTVEDRDRSIGTYFVRYIDSDNPQQQEPGAIARFFGAKSPEPALQSYRIVVRAQSGRQDASDVVVQQRDEAVAATADSDATRERMLGLIAEQLAL